MHLGKFAGEHGSAERRTATNADQKRLLGALGIKEPPVATRLNA